ncbi:hypothetical protein GBA52_008254, partial [Prunus armeniaca]
AGSFVLVVLLILLLSLASYLSTTSTNPSFHQSRASPIPADQYSSDQQGLDEATILSSNMASAHLLLAAICLADYKETNTLLVLPDCGHLFHVKCVYPWLGCLLLASYVGCSSSSLHFCHSDSTFTY